MIFGEINAFGVNYCVLVFTLLYPKRSAGKNKK
jgi:hypothetical protein